MSNQFGGNWTRQKIEIVVEYVKAYLQIMKKHKYWKLLYFDGFAGSGIISQTKGLEENVIKGAARRVLSIDNPCSFDMYYFVEKNSKLADRLRKTIDKDFKSKKIISHVVSEDCNKKLYDMAAFLKGSGKDYKVLAYIDPCGMQLHWDSIAALKGLSIDTWILIPLGMGVNRLLTKDGKIADQWMKKLKDFLGISEAEIRERFYKTQTVQTLFGEEEDTFKKEKAIEIAGNLYRERMKTVFTHVSQPFFMMNKRNNVMYHFLLGSNNTTAVKIANDVVKKWSMPYGKIKY